MLPSGQKSGLQSALKALFAVLPLLPPCDDMSLTAVCALAFVAEVVPQIIYIVYSFVSDWALRLNMYGCV